MMVWFKDMTKKLVAVVAACLMAFYGMASCMAADAFYEDQIYYMINYETGQKQKYTLDVDLPIYNGNGGATRAGSIDDRVPDQETSVVQIAAIGGTGFIIDKHIIATAAHCIYDINKHSFVSNMRVDIYDENCTKVIKTLYPKEGHIAMRFRPNGNSMYDYALLYFEEDLSEYGMFSLGIATDDFMTSGATVTVSGFPQSTASDPGANCTKRYKADGQIAYMNDNTDEKNHRIMYTAFASGGDSGGPVYTTQTFNGKTYHTVIGINTEGSYYDPEYTMPATYRFGTRVTSTLLVFYYNNEYIGSTIS